MRPPLIVVLSLVLAACTPAEVTNESDESAQPLASNLAEAGDTEPANGPQLERTAWRAIAQDGAIYTTFLDQGGLYRDFRNGDPWRDGRWGRNDAGQLCFTPKDTSLTGDCWTLRTPGKNGTMRARNGSGLSIRLQQVAYIAPVDPELAE